MCPVTSIQNDRNSNVYRLKKKASPFILRATFARYGYVAHNTVTQQ